MSKYLSESELNFNFDYFSIKPKSSDSYNETILKTLINDRTDFERKELFAVALQFSIIGQANQEGGITEIDGDEMSISEINNDLGVETENNSNVKMEEDVFTPKRLARIFRFEIKKFIVQTGSESFLSSKYGDGQFISETFPCAEYLIDDTESANHLIHVYSNLDAKLNTKFVDRIKNVLRVRGIIQ